MTFRRHRFEWTPSSVARFWDFVSEHAPASSYFSAQAGANLLRLLRQANVDVGKRVLDFGCGPGHFLAELVATGAECQGVDFSAASARAANTLLNGRPEFRGVLAIDGVPTPLPDAAFDTVFMLEAIEHLLDDQLAPTLDELARLTRKGGTVVLTTPNDETLEESDVMCPSCGAVFHSIQHVRKFTRQSISALMSRHGFEPVCVEATWLGPETLRGRAVRGLRRLLRQKPRNLVYVGRRSPPGGQP